MPRAWGTEQEDRQGAILRSPISLFPLLTTARDPPRCRPEIHNQLDDCMDLRCWWAGNVFSRLTLCGVCLSLRPPPNRLVSLQSDLDSNHLPRLESQSASAKNPASLQRLQVSESRESHVAKPLQLSKVLPEAGPDKTEAWERPRVGQPAEVRSEEMNASKT